MKLWLKYPLIFVVVFAVFFFLMSTMSVDFVSYNEILYTSLLTSLVIAVITTLTLFAIWDLSHVLHKREY